MAVNDFCAETPRGISAHYFALPGPGPGLANLRRALEYLRVGFENTRKFGIKILARRARILIPNFRRRILRLIAA